MCTQRANQVQRWVSRGGRFLLREVGNEVQALEGLNRARLDSGELLTSLSQGGIIMVIVLPY